MLEFSAAQSDSINDQDQYPTNYQDGTSFWFGRNDCGDTFRVTENTLANFPVVHLGWDSTVCLNFCHIYNLFLSET